MLLKEAVHQGVLKIKKWIFLNDSYFYGKWYGEHVYEFSEPSDNFYLGESHIYIGSQPPLIIKKINRLV